MQYEAFDKVIGAHKRWDISIIWSLQLPWFLLVQIVTESHLSLHSFVNLELPSLPSCPQPSDHYRNHNLNTCGAVGALRHSSDKQKVLAF